MKQVQTVTGKVDVQELKYVLMHEHLQVGYAGWHLDPTAPKYVKDEVKKKALDRMAEIKDYGVNCIVDPCPMELGRDPEFMAEISVLSGMHIVCSTGFDVEERGGLLAIRPLTKEQLQHIYLKEIEDGIGESGVKPGIIKAATGFNAITAYEEKCLWAASQAAKAAGLPIITHTEKGTMGPEQIGWFKKHGVPAGKCLIGHCCANHDITYHLSILKEGAFVGFDRFGLEAHTKDELRMVTLASLVHLGYSSQLMISCDSVCHYMGRNPYRAEDTRNWHPRFIFNEVLPQLKSFGVGEEAIQQMLNVNPKRIFS